MKKSAGPQSSNQKTPLAFQIIPPPEMLKKVVECFRIAEYSGGDSLSVKVCPNGLPGMVFHRQNGHPAIKKIALQSGSVAYIPTLFIHGLVTEPSVMNFNSGPYTTIQVVLKPHALKTLLGIDASALTNGSIQPCDFAAESLNARLMDTKNAHECIPLLTRFLSARFTQANSQDALVEESLRFIHESTCSVTVKSLLEHVNLSERQFEKRFVQTVGVSPQFYIRVRRFNEAMRLMNCGHYQRLTDVATALNFYDQSHFIHDIKAFSGITPKRVAQNTYDFRHDQVGSSYL